MYNYSNKQTKCALQFLFINIIIIRIKLLLKYHLITTISINATIVYNLFKYRM